MKSAFFQFFAVFLLSSALLSCSDSTPEKKSDAKKTVTEGPIPLPVLVVLGTIQDAGSPQIGCVKDCCKDLFETPDPNRMVVSLGLIDRLGKKYLFEATPDLPRQWSILQKIHPEAQRNEPDGIFLSHAHIGHYTGLMYLGREAMNAHSTAVYAMPRMTNFLQHNGPWNLLWKLGNISFPPTLEANNSVALNQVNVIPILVPHRDEFSETVGYRIEGPNKSALFIPDIDKWSKWETDITEEIARVDYAFLDATFFDGAEINNRDISEIPHPFVVESLEAFKNLNSSEKQKIYFIHFNHTNPIINPDSDESKQVRAAGFNIAALHQQFSL